VASPETYGYTLSKEFFFSSFFLTVFLHLTKKTPRSGVFLEKIIVTQLGKGQMEIKMSLYFNRAARHEGVLGECWYSSTHS
jgi:hypothetical protein